MRSLLKLFFCMGILLVCLSPAQAAPPANSPPPSVTVPDYGGRDSAPVTTGEAAPNPVAQVGRTVEALVIVLAGVVGLVYVLKRFGLVTPGENGKPGRIALSQIGRMPRAQAPEGASVTVISSQALPGGAMLHVVSVAGKNLLLGITPQSVSALTEWSAEEEPASPDFENALARADAAGGGIAAANARLRSLMARPASEDHL